MSYKRIHRSYPRTILAKFCDDCGVPEGLCAEGWPFFGESQTDINGAPLDLLFSIPSFKFDGVSMVPELNYVEALTNCGMISCWGLTPQILSFPNNELDNFDILEYSINIIEPVYKYTIVFTMSWRDYSKPQLPKSSTTYKNENYDSWVERTSFSFSNTHTQEAPCAVDVSANFPLGGSRLPLPANTIISGIINKSEIQSTNEEMIRRYFPSGLLGAPDSIDISIRLSGEEICADSCLTGTQYDRRRCSHGVIYRRGTSLCEKPCRLTSDCKGTGWRIEQDEGGLPESWHYLGPNGMGENVGGSVVIGPGGEHVGECIIATSDLCASIGGIWESAYCCPSPSPSVCPCPLVSPSPCADNCACLSVAQPSIKICDINCQDWCTGGYISLPPLPGDTPVPGGSMINPIPWYGNVPYYNIHIPSNPGDDTGPPGYCTAVWNLDGATTALCFGQGDASPGGYIRVSLRCLQATPSLYDIQFTYYQCPGLFHTGTGVNQNLCVVDGILTGCVILNLSTGGCGRTRPPCTMKLTFGEI